MVGEAAIPSSRCLLKPIERLVEAAYMVGLGSINEP
jgi:hypothetical protein